METITTKLVVCSITASFLVFVILGYVLGSVFGSIWGVFTRGAKDF